MSFPLSKRSEYANLDFGSDFSVSIESPFEVLDLGDANIVALPYTGSLDEK
ncbi:MAG: hypothetical protein QXE05_00310 [Nitrososphaeria archaeon]